MLYCSQQQILIRIRYLCLIWGHSSFLYGISLGDIREDTNILRTFLCKYYTTWNAQIFQPLYLATCLTLGPCNHPNSSSKNDKSLLTAGLTAFFFEIVNTIYYQTEPHNNHKLSTKSNTFILPCSIFNLPFWLVKWSWDVESTSASRNITNKAFQVKEKAMFFIKLWLNAFSHAPSIQM